MSDLTRIRPTAEWIALLEDKAVPCGPINTIDKTFADPQVKHLGIAQKVHSNSLGEITLLAQPYTLSRTPSKLVSGAPEAGEQTDEILAEFGYSAAEIATMHERKAVMAQRADAFVALPGGIGTLEEIFEVWTWQPLGLHDKPVAFYDIHGYWTPLLRALDGMVDAGFLSLKVRGSLVVADTPQALWAGLGQAER